jgi:hypothetical protein
MAKRQRSFTFSDHPPGDSRRRELRGSDEGIDVKRVTLTSFSDEDIRSAALALIACIAPSLVAHP